MTNQAIINFLDQVRKILLDDKSWLESTIQPINEAFDKAITALEKQIPMKPMTPEIGFSLLHPIIIPCGNCGMALEVELEGMKKYCPWCGQAINWEGGW